MTENDAVAIDRIDHVAITVVVAAAVPTDAAIAVSLTVLQRLPRMSPTATPDHPLGKSIPVISQAESGTPIEPAGIGPAVVNRIESEIALETAAVATMIKTGHATVVIETEETEQSVQTGTQNETVTVTVIVVETATATAIENVTETAAAETAKRTVSVPVVIDQSPQTPAITLPTPEPGV